LEPAVFSALPGGEVSVVFPDINIMMNCPAWAWRRRKEVESSLRDFSRAAIGEVVITNKSDF
jgi:hypothetical protein